MAIEILESPVLPIHDAVGASFNTFTTLQDVSPQPVFKMAANRLMVGSEITLRAAGHFGCTATPTLTLGFYYGTPASVALAVSTATTLGSGAAAWPFEMEWIGRVMAIGTAGSIVGQGQLRLGTSLAAYSVVPIPITAALRTVAIDTSIEKNLGVCAAFSASNAANLVVVNRVSLRIMG